MSYLVSALVDMLLLLALEASAISATAVVYFLSEGFRASNYKKTPQFLRNRSMLGRWMKEQHMLQKDILPIHTLTASFSVLGE